MYSIYIVSIRTKMNKEQIWTRKVWFIKWVHIPNSLHNKAIIKKYILEFHVANNFIATSTKLAKVRNIQNISLLKVKVEWS